MTNRDAELQTFVDAAHAAFAKFTNHAESERSIGQIFDVLKQPGEQRAGEGKQLPVCQYLDAAMAVDLQEPSLRRLVESFRAIAPRLDWRRRVDTAGTASGNYVDGHGNAMVLGPGGIEARNDLWIGATLLAPNVRYPDHDHAPEETYLVLSHSEFRQGDDDWFAPGIGGSFYNIPDIKHAMRSLDTPLFAFWALLVKNPH
ncbi:dimethylsulfoniopropionate lyase [Falsochrobactrum sp. TDYN1]|uniref:Dimethylsulfoniopropionate lyase n=1 Tax=Falsochrobactrum tianjinense TaxID=2706015 RepID=A0A949PLQ1_9HYPH|nr:dimethylsulfonioproprionate lyase family protein [Falsochrobactrum sp. TDYN1]MBV2143586.1 dimethylsulfoniopropionate lyase [Falsochrobactrum sp. TDYN1]